MVDGSSFKRTYPALRLLEIANLALSPLSVLIAALAMFVFSLASGLVDLTIRSEGLVIVKTNPAEVAATAADVASVIQRRSTVMVDLSSEFERIAEPELIRPWSSLIGPAFTIVSHPPGLNSWLNTLLKFAMALSLWSLVGVVLCRRAAFLFAGEDNATIVRAVKYSLRRWPATVGAPIIPAVATLLIGILLVCLGFVGRIPGLGGAWLAAISPGVAVLGLVMAFLFFVTILSWPLMVAAISVDDCDSFGGLSRAYSNLTGRPWHALFFAVIAILVGRLVMLVVNLFAVTAIWFAESSISFGAGAVQTTTWLHSPLTEIVQLIVSGIGVSFFWSAATIIYLLLRHEVDMAPFDRIALDDEDRPVREPLPVVGMPATDARAELNGSQPGVNT